MAIGAANKTSGSNNTNQVTPYTTASVSFVTARLYLFSVATHDATSIPAHAITASGGLTFTEVATRDFNTIASPNKRITVFRCMPSGDETTTVSFSIGGVQTMQNGRWSIDEFTGVETSGGGSGAIVQSVTNRADSGTSLTVTLAAFASADNVGFGAFSHAANEVTTPGVGFTELADVPGDETPTTNIQTEWKLNDNTVDASWSTSGANAGIGIELAVASGGAPIVARRLLLGVGT